MFTSMHRHQCNTVYSKLIIPTDFRNLCNAKGVFMRKTIGRKKLNYFEPYKSAVLRESAQRSSGLACWQTATAADRCAIINAHSRKDRLTLRCFSRDAQVLWIPTYLLLSFSACLSSLLCETSRRLDSGYRSWFTIPIAQILKDKTNFNLSQRETN